MTPAEADKYTTLRDCDFQELLDEYQDPRPDLIEIKNACLRYRASIRDGIEERGPSPKAADALKWVNRKITAVDAALTRLKHLKGSVTEGGTAWEYSHYSEEFGFFTSASMMPPAEFRAYIYRHLDEGEQAPVLLAFIAQPDIAAIKPEFWDHTCPNRNEIEAVAGNPASQTAS